jgi:tetratricopeptide (TPR) repeat protein
MKRSLKTLAIAAAALSVFATAGCDKLRARDQLNKGVNAFKNAKYEQAINNFKQAVAYDPSLLNAKLYLATAYAQQYIPGVDSPENLQNANSAIEQYKLVLDQDPKNVNRMILRPTTPSASSTGPRPTSRAWKSARNWGCVRMSP